jgi:hypothetical protein
MNESNKKPKFKVIKEKNEDNTNKANKEINPYKIVPQNMNMNSAANSNSIKNNNSENKSINNNPPIHDEIYNLNNVSNLNFNFLKRKTKNSSSSEFKYNIDKEASDTQTDSNSIPIFSEYSNWKEKPNVSLEKLKNKITQLDKDLEINIKINFADSRQFDFNTEKDMKATLTSLEKRFQSKIKSIHFQTINKYKRNSKIADADFHKLDKYISFIKGIIEENNLILKPIDIENTINKFVSEFGESCLEEFEKLVILILTEKYKFSEINSYVYLYIYDNMRKLRDPKTIESFKSKLKDAQVIQDLSMFSIMMSKYYCKRAELMGRILEKNLRIANYDEENSFIEIMISSFLFVKFESLRELDLTQYYVMNENFLPIFAAIRLNTQITRIILNSNKLGEEGAWHLGRLLTYNKNIQELDISINLLSDDALKALVLGLNLKKDSHYKLGFNIQLEKSTQTSLVKLSLFNNSLLTSNSGKHIANILEVSPNLKTLNISKINLEDQGFSDIVKRICIFREFKELKSKLETIIAYNTKLRSESMYSLAQCLKHPNCPISSLTLSDNKLETAALKNFFASLTDNKCLKELNLTNCEIGNDLIEDICELLEKNRTLENFVLYNNKIDSQISFEKILSRVSSHRDEPVCNFLDTFSLENDYTQFNSIREGLLDIPCQESNFNQIKKISLKHLDLSKNKCKIDLTRKFIDLINKIQLQTLDISQNFEFPTFNEEMSKKFKEIITNIQDKTKIIY